MTGMDEKGENEKFDHTKSLKEQKNYTETEMKVDCQVCQQLADFRTGILQIPFFKEVVLMAFSCDSCGFKNSEFKIMDDISPKGRKMVL